MNKLRGTINVVAVKAPGFGDRRKENLGDIAALTGGTVISDELGRRLDSVEVEDLGRARRVVIAKDETTIVEGRGTREDIDGRIVQIKAALETTTSDWDREKLQERLGKLAGSVAVIKVGAATEVELQGAQAPRRGRPQRHPRRHRRGHRARRWRRADQRHGRRSTSWTSKATSAPA